MMELQDLNSRDPFKSSVSFAVLGTAARRWFPNRIYQGHSCRPLSRVRGNSAISSFYLLHFNVFSISIASNIIRLLVKLGIGCGRANLSDITFTCIVGKETPGAVIPVWPRNR